MSKDGLRLNGLNRFSKSESGLTLEVHSHCEVPAGCGGAVLRWRRPGQPIGLNVSKYVNGRVDEGFFLDGESFKEQRVVVRPGEHVLSFTVDEPGDGGLVMLKMELLPKLPTAKHPSLLSGVQGRWCAATEAPPDGWRTPAFDDSLFTPLIEREVPEPSGKAKWRWQFLIEVEARGLGLPAAKRRGWRKWLGSSPSVQRVWVRCLFHVDDQGFA